MVTGASTADLAIMLVDARKGLLEQSRRHATIVSLLRRSAHRSRDQQDGPRRLVGGRVREIRAEFLDFAARLDFTDVTVIPMSALDGRQRRAPVDRTCPGTRARSLLHHLEHVYIASDRNLVDVRFPVQYVIRPQNGRGDYRAFAGQVVGGVLKPGDDVLVLPSGMPTTIRAIDTADGEVAGGVPADVRHRAAHR